jgi:hypothetical protein
MKHLRLCTLPAECRQKKKNARRLKESRRAWCLKYSLRVVENYRVLLSENRLYVPSREVSTRDQTKRM